MKFFSKKLIGPFIGIIIILLILNSIDLNKSLEALKHFNLIYLILMIPAYYSAFLFRVLRWRAILAENKSIKFSSLLDSIFRGWTVNCIVPARGGEIYRAHYFGKKEEISRVKILASIVLERVFDGLVLFLILFLLVSFVFSSKKFFGVAVAAGIVFAGGFITLLLTSKFHQNTFIKEKLSSFADSLPNFLKKPLNKIAILVSSFINGLDMVNSPFLILKTFLFTSLVWLCEGLTLFLLIKGVGFSIGILGSLFVLSVTAFVSLIPGGPGALGPLQWGYIIALGFFKIPQETAFAASIINQFFALLCVSSGSLFFISTNYFKLKDLTVTDKVFSKLKDS